MNEVQEQRRLIGKAFSRTGANQAVQREMRRVMQKSFEQTGCVPAVELVSQEVGAAWCVVKKHYLMIKNSLPEREAVEAAYAGFLEEACLSQDAEPSHRLLQLASDAKLTANRIGNAINVDPAYVELRAAELGIELSTVEAPGLALPRRLTEEALRALRKVPVNASTAARVAGVSYQTLYNKLKRFEVDLPRQGMLKQPEKALRGKNEIDRPAIVEEIRRLGTSENVIVAAARTLLASAGHEPDELVPGAYSDPDGKLCCDEIQMTDGQAVAVIYAYRPEAKRVRQVLGAVLQVCDEMSGKEAVVQAA